jgi:Domain of unknown function (DUF4337)
VTTDNSSPQFSKQSHSSGIALNWEIVFGCTLAIIAAVLAINDLAAGRYGDDELQMANEKSSAYQWYQSKSIKESLVEGQKDLLTTLLEAEAISPAKQENLKKFNNELGVKLLRYKKEKKEILLGSEAVGKDNWAQDVEGEMGKVTGAKATEQRLEVLGRAGDRFDLANLFLQLSLVLGAIGLVGKNTNVKKVFYAVMVSMAAVGGVFCIIAYRLAAS